MRNMDAQLVIINIDDCFETLSRPEVFCSEARLKKCAEIGNDAVRTRGYAAELALSYALSGEKLLPPKYHYEKKGRPVIEGGYISLSHSGKYAVCAYSVSPVGVDIEVPRHVDARIAKRVLSERELEEFHSTEDENYLLRKFVMKAAFLKMTGEGITGGLSGIEEENGIVFRNGKSTGFCRHFGKYEFTGFVVSKEDTVFKICRPIM